jgi:flagellar hook-length control protein FliK
MPDLAQNATAEVSEQADSGTTSLSVSEQFSTVAAPVIPTLDDSSAPSDDVDSSADLDAAATESLATSGSEPALLLGPAASGQDANIVDGALLPQHMPTDPATSAPSQPAAPQSAAAGSPEWAEAREMVSIRTAHAVQDGVQNVSIDLHPAELGHVGIELSFHAGGVSVQMTLSRQDAYEAFSRDRAALEQQLAQTGINLGSGGLDLRFDQKRDQPPAFSGNAFATRIQPMQPDAAALAATRPHTARGLLNIIA